MYLTLLFKIFVVSRSFIIQLYTGLLTSNLTLPLTLDSVLTLRCIFGTCSVSILIQDQIHTKAAWYAGADLIK